MEPNKVIVTGFDISIGEMMSLTFKLSVALAVNGMMLGALWLIGLYALSLAK